MLQQQFIDIFKSRQAPDASHMANLELLVKEYPYFESAHLLYTKVLNDHNAISYPKQLRKTAIVANSRKVLYELLHAKTPVVVQNIVAQVKPEVKEEIKPAEQTEQTVVNPVTITNNDIKVVYINTVAPVVNIPEVKETIVAESKNTPDELEMVKAIENETDEFSHLTQVENPEEKLTREIELEIGKGIVQSYVQTDVIKTPELHKTEDAEPVSFTDWLGKIKKEAGTIQTDTGTPLLPKQETTEKVEKAEKIKEIDKKSAVFDQKKQIIDKIIDTDPGRIKLGGTKFFTPTIDAKQSLLENEHLVTETLAKIYALQGNVSKAIRAYEILSLKFPQKSAYFSSLIEKLKSR